MVAAEATNTPDEHRIIGWENTETLGESHEERSAQDATQWGSFMSFNAVIWHFTFAIRDIARDSKDG
jgi:hypothetical protein